MSYNDGTSDKEATDTKVESTTTPPAKFYAIVNGRTKQPEPECLVDDVHLCHYQSVKTYKLCSGNGKCNTATGKCTCIAAAADKYILDNYKFGDKHDYIKSWNCQILNNNESPYKNTQGCMNIIFNIN